MNPYITLDVPHDADDAAIRAAYLGRIKQFNPEVDPAGFSRVREAYDLIKNIDSRCRWLLFNTTAPEESSPVDVLLQSARHGPQHPRSWESLRDFLRTCAMANR